MASIKRFEEIKAWQKARELVNAVYAVTQEGAFARDFGLRDQIQRAAVSVMSNIAEGFERSGNQEFTQFLYVAKGSCGEMRSQLYVAVDQGYIAEKEAEQLLLSLKRLSSMIGSLINYLKRSGMKGAKYNGSKLSDEV